MFPDLLALFTARPSRSLLTASVRLPAVGAALLLALTSPLAAAATPAELLAAYTAEAGAAASAVRGEAFFTSRHGREWACASCHGAKPVQDGKHAATGKVIGPLAPAFNPQRFTDAGKADKWFRRNCQDVVGRTCTAAEKADVLAWLVSLR